MKYLLSCHGHEVKVLDEQAVIARVNSKLKQADQKAERQLDSTLNQIERLRNQKSGFIKLLAEGTISEEEYREVAASNNKDIVRLQEKVNHLKATQSERINASDHLKLRKELEKFIGLEVLIPAVLHRFVNKVVVTADGTAQVHYKFAAIS